MIAKLPSISVIFFLICACSREKSTENLKNDHIKVVQQSSQEDTPKNEHDYLKNRNIQVKIIDPGDPSNPPEPIWAYLTPIIDSIVPLNVIPKDTIFDFAAIMPEFVGGEKALIRFLQTNLIYPEQAKELGIEGKVFVSLVIFEDGSIHNETILRGINGNTSCDQEALRLVKQMPNWIPGRNENGDKLKIRVKIPVVFRLN